MKWNKVNVLLSLNLTVFLTTQVGSPWPFGRNGKMDSLRVFPVLMFRYKKICVITRCFLSLGTFCIVCSPRDVDEVVLRNSPKVLHVVPLLSPSRVSWETELLYLKSEVPLVPTIPTVLSHVPTPDPVSLSTHIFWDI